MGFMQVLRRFILIRGHRRKMTSDNGTKFVEVEKELKMMIQGWSQDELRDFGAEKSITWKFTMPATPHQNDNTEALVESYKGTLKTLIGSQVLTAFELYTCLMEVANLVNWRSIGRIPMDLDDRSYICLNDILLGRASTQAPQGPFRETKNPRHRVVFIQKIIDSFWKRWVKDVLPSLVPCKRWTIQQRNVRIDDIVVTLDKDVIRGKWTLGRVIATNPGDDGRVRNV
ncbi:uncharacterized protein [Palaemon carinicauda]|uniref:uncharacterized protein n=1 Tax=Palaemon carinicauda TaxID=392227 RepID=UPI0035B6602A